MIHLLSAMPRWSTASFGDAAETLPKELSILGEHLKRCRGPRGRWFDLQCTAETLNGFVAAHFVTTLVAIALLIGVFAMVR